MRVSLAQFAGPETQSSHSVTAELHAVQGRTEDPGGGLRLLRLQERQGLGHHRRQAILGYDAPLPWRRNLCPPVNRKINLNKSSSFSVIHNLKGGRVAEGGGVFLLFFAGQFVLKSYRGVSGQCHSRYVWATRGQKAWNTYRQPSRWQGFLVQIRKDRG